MAEPVAHVRHQWQSGKVPEPDSRNESQSWSDDPLSATPEDDLGRGPFIASVAAQIDLVGARDSSTVFGLVGEWGSGKTTILKGVRNLLASDWIVADFTPWSSGDAAAMPLEFVATLADALEVTAAGESRAKFARYAGLVSPLLAAIPVIGSGFSGLASGAFEALSNRPPWHKQFEELSEVIAAVGARVLIVIDDLDRLGSSELLNVLRIVRLLGRFRGVHYLIAYDQETIEALIRTSESAGRPTSFMEKIVQHPFEVPPISRASALRLTHGLISKLLAAANVRLDEVGLQREAELARVLAQQIRTPRTLARFSAQLLAFATHVRGAELDALDYIGVTWLRLQAHSVWAQLLRWRPELFSGTRSSGLLTSEKISLDQWLDRINTLDPSLDALDVASILDSLYPGISIEGVSSFYAHPNSLADEAYSGRYFLLALPEDDVSDELIREALESLISGTSGQRTQEFGTLLDGNEDLANLAISRAWSVRRGSPTTSRELIDFLLARSIVQSVEERFPGSPAVSITPWLAREIALGVEAGYVGPEEIISRIGEAEATIVVMHFSNVLRDRDRAKSLAAGFADYWIEMLTSSGFLSQGAADRLGQAVDVISFAYGSERIEGVFDDAIRTFDDYLDLAFTFVKFVRWVGSSVSYEVTFNEGAFVAIVSEHIRRAFAGQVESSRRGVPYEKDDLPSASLTEEQMREFVLDALVAADLREEHSRRGAQED